MSDVQFENFPLQSATHAFSAVWKWTRALKKAGATVKASSNGTTKDTSGVAANDLWGGNADPAVDTYPTALDTVSAWICLQLVSTLKVIMTTAPTGTFVRGEKVTQATSSAEGEFVGYDFDGVSNGHAVIIPRTGTFDASHVITGAVSGATFTPTGLKTFVHEIVLWKNTDLVNGMIFNQCICAEDETNNRFSVLATQSSCTATVAPGGAADASNNPFPQKGSTTIAAGSNGAILPQATINLVATQNAAGQDIFPTNGAAIVTTSSGPQLVTYTGKTATTLTGCTGGIGTMSTGGAVSGPSTFGSYVSLGTNVNGTNTFALWFAISTNMGKAQVIATNMIGAAGISPDGTAAVGLGSTATGTGFEFFGFFRCDDTQDADLDPFLFFHSSTTTISATNAQRTAVTQAISSQPLYAFLGQAQSNGQTGWRGNRRRGFITQDPNAATVQTGDAFMGYFGAGLAGWYNGTFYNGNFGNTPAEVLSCAYTTKRLRERVFMLAMDPANKDRKGTLRWLSNLATSNTVFDTLDGKTKMVVWPQVILGNPCFVLGPFDGSSVPSQA